MLVRFALVSLLCTTIGGCGTRTAQLTQDKRLDASIRADSRARDLAGDTLPDICKAWTCTTSQGRTFCQNPQSPGLPGIGFWSCHLLLPPHTAVPTWRCRGAVPYGGLVELVVPCAGSWTCEQRGDNGQHDIYRCEKPDDLLDRPPPELTSGKHVLCIKGSDWGTRCELLDAPPQVPPPWAALTTANDPCRPGTELWCTRPQGGWGLVSCGDDGRWPGRWAPKQGRRLLDCQPTPDGRVPDTACACYFTAKANSACCERSDCLVPRGGLGRRCEASPGAFCDECDPQQPSCANGALCLLENSGESYCTLGCAQQACPPDTTCSAISATASLQCVPTDRSCYF